MSDQKAADGPQERPGGGCGTRAASEGPDDPQAGADGLDAHNAGPTVRECAEADRAYWERKDAGEAP